MMSIGVSSIGSVAISVRVASIRVAGIGQGSGNHLGLLTGSRGQES